MERLPKRAREVVEYRKSGLSLNHIQGCPLGCAYCIRHTYGLWDQRLPRALMTDVEAVEELVSHRYFQPHVTPVQVFNRSTDPFLPSVRPHTLAVLEDLDARELTNHVLLITRHQMKPEDIDRLHELRHIKVTLLFTYSGIDNRQIEPYPSHVAAESLKLMSAPQWRKYRTILYWRPLVPGLNNSDEHFDQAHELAQHADATAFTGLFYRDQIAAYYKADGLPEPYEDTARLCATRTSSGGMAELTSDGRTANWMADWTSLNYVVVDVEGNGQQPPDLVELGAVPIVDGIIGEPMSWLVHPERPIKYFATRIHGLTNKDVADAPVFTAVKDEVLRALNGAALVAHNAHIDVGVLDRKLGDWQHPEVFDTLKLARRVLPAQESYRLDGQDAQPDRAASRRSHPPPCQLRRLSDGSPVRAARHVVRHPRAVAGRTALRLTGRGRE